VRCTTEPATFQRRGCELPLDLLGPRGAFPEQPPASDALVVTRRHARVGLRTARCAVPFRPPLAERQHVDFPASQRTPERPAGKGETHGSPRASSVVSRPFGLITRRPSLSPACSAFDLLAHPFAVSPPVLRVRRAWGFLRASVPHHQRGLATSRCEERTMRPTDFCHPNQDDDPLVARSRLLEPLSRSGTPVTIRGRHAA
jgi:hypothetical protein